MICQMRSVPVGIVETVESVVRFCLGDGGSQWDCQTGLCGVRSGY